MEKRRIGILGYNGVTAINLVGPLEAFSNTFVTNDSGEQIGCYETLLIARSENQFTADSGVVFRTASVADNDLSLDTLIIPGGRGLHCQETSEQIAIWIARHADKVRRIASVCTGIYGLAPTGLLDGRRVTTHWQHAADVAARFPKLRMEESAIVLKDGKFYTAAGATAGIDLALTLVAEDFGRDVAVRVARKLLVYFRRDGGQEQYSEPTCVNGCSSAGLSELGVSRMGKLLDWIKENLGEDLRLDVLAKRAMLSRNELIQLFTGTFGSPPGLYVKNLRFNEARRRLMSGQSAVTIARSVGFADPAYFIQEFRRRYGALPDDYQRRFGSGPTQSTEDSAAANGLSSVNGEGEALLPYRRPRITSFTRCVRQRVSSPK